MSRPMIVIVISLGIIVIASLLLRVTVFSASAEPKRKTISVGGSSLVVLIADTPRLHARGLSGRPSLTKESGMLFVFDDAAYHAISMKDMHFAIDILWFSPNRELIGVTA